MFLVTELAAAALLLAFCLRLPQRENAPAGYGPEGTAGRYASDNAPGRYAPDNAPGGYEPENTAGEYASDSAAAGYGWMDGPDEAPAGGVIRRGAVSDRSRKPFAGAGLRPERQGYAGGRTAGEAPDRESDYAGAGGRSRESGYAGTGGRSRESSYAGAGGRSSEGSTARAGGALRADSTAAGTRYGNSAEQASAKSSVMDDLVQMASADDGVLREELFSIDECMENILMLQEPVCAKKRIHLEYKKSVSMPAQAIGDKSKLQRALVSLLESVTEQTPSGSVISVGCRADKASRNRAYLYFTIRDNDSKLAGDLMQGMFEMKDERDDPLRAGLYIAREIISTMGGNVRVRSRRGEGTEFMVTVIMKLP